MHRAGGLWPDRGVRAEQGRASMRVFATLPQEDLRGVGAVARTIEVDGYDGVVAMENKHDPFWRWR